MIGRKFIFSYETLWFFYISLVDCMDISVEKKKRVATVEVDFVVEMKNEWWHGIRGKEEKEGEWRIFLWDYMIFLNILIDYMIMIVEKEDDNYDGRRSGGTDKKKIRWFSGGGRGGRDIFVVLIKAA